METTSFISPSIRSTSKRNIFTSNVLSSSFLEGYSIIGQGQIEKILSGRPAERRELFDEAAGIVKYKRRKVTAQKKLETERENLVRVKDILAELERQVGPLERQSEKARTYLKKKDELNSGHGYFLKINVQPVVGIVHGDGHIGIA